MDWAFAIAKQYPHIYFLVRFHYWAILNNELHNTSRFHSFNNYQIIESDLHELLLASDFMVTGTSSVGIEAIASGCMPISYKPTRRYDFGRIQDVEESAFLYTNQSELQKAINECITQSDVFAWKKTQWEKNLQKLCTPLDGKASSRLYNWLDKKDVFNMKAV
jgi:predicted glycosyltransferase